MRAFRRGVSHLRANPVLSFGVALGLIARVIYWQATDRRFEDGLITVVHAVNAADGIGLTHHPYEPATHGFTSALSVLTPLVGELLGKLLGFVDGFLTLRLAGLVAFAVTAVFADRICRRLDVATLPRLFVLVFLALDYNHVMYGMSGMETQIAVGLLLATIDATMRRAFVAAGVLCGLCLLARPDFALLVGPVLLALVLWQRREGVRAALLAGAVVAPWLIFTTAYYGSPVANTIEAKSLRYHVETPAIAAPGEWLALVRAQVAERLEPTWHQITPFLNNVFVVDAPLPTWASAAIALAIVLLALVGAFTVRRRRAFWPALAFVGLYLVYRFAALPDFYYEWYYPPVTAVVVICAGLGLTRLAALAPRPGAAAAVVMAALFAWPFPYMVALDSRIQHGIEDQVRVPMGEWLRANVPPGESLTSESAGYVGYYGRVKLWDYPGLTSRTALGFMRELGWRRNNMLALIDRAQPRWIVLRPGEADALSDTFPATAAAYREAARFSVPPDEPRLDFGGVAMSNVDRDFVVMRRVGGS